MVPPTASSLIHKAAQEQDVLGWDNFLLGWITSTWALAQQQHFDVYASTTNAHLGNAWMKRMISRVYDLVHDVWMYRNSVVHTAVEEKLNQQEFNKLNLEIDRIYSLGKHRLCHTHRHLMDEGIVVTKEKNVWQKKYWVRTLQVSSHYQKNADENMYV